MKDNEVLCLNVYSQYFIVNHKARYKLFKNQVVASLLNEMGIDDEEIVRKISIDFAMLLNRFFMYNLSKEELESVIPDTQNKNTYIALIKIVEQASKENTKQADLINNIKELGEVAVNIAKKVPGLKNLI